MDPALYLEALTGQVRRTRAALEDFQHVHMRFTRGGLVYVSDRWNADELAARHRGLIAACDRATRELSGYLQARSAGVTPCAP